MICPFCQTENRDDRETCYACDKDISMLRLIANKARHHYNLALEHAERGRLVEAIDELHNALDLDKRFVNAHVVLGTLHAKRNEFDKAREAWTAALALQPELGKAHNYLERVQVVQTMVPAMQRLRVAVLGLLLVVVSLTALLVYVQKPDRSLALLRESQTAYEERNYGKALKQLARVRTNTHSQSAVAVAAKALSSAIETDIRQQITLIKELKYRKEYSKALEQIAELEAHEPDVKTSATLATLKEDINSYYEQEVQDLFGRYARGEMTYQQLTQNVNEYLKTYPDVPEKQQLFEYLEAALQSEIEHGTQAIQETFAADHDIKRALADFQTLADQFKDSEDMQKARSTVVSDIVNWLFENEQDLERKSDFPAAREQLNQIGSLAAEFRDVVDLSGILEFSWRLLLEKERGQRLRNAEKLVKNGDSEDAIEALMQLYAEDDLTTSERQLLAQYVRELDRREIADQLSRIKDRASRYASLQITEREARETMSAYRNLLSMLRDTDSADRATVLVCAAASAIKLGEAERATKILAEAKRENPENKLLAQLQKLTKKGKRERD